MIRCGEKKVGKNGTWSEKERQISGICHNKIFFGNKRHKDTKKDRKRPTCGGNSICRNNLDTDLEKIKCRLSFFFIISFIII